MFVTATYRLILALPCVAPGLDAPAISVDLPLGWSPSVAPIRRHGTRRGLVRTQRSGEKLRGPLSIALGPPNAGREPRKRR
jgi:hypothetical protein